MRRFLIKMTTNDYSQGEGTLTELNTRYHVKGQLQSE